MVNLRALWFSPWRREEADVLEVEAFSWKEEALVQEAAVARSEDLVQARMQAVTHKLPSLLPLLAPPHLGVTGALWALIEQGRHDEGGHRHSRALLAWQPHGKLPRHKSVWVHPWLQKGRENLYLPSHSLVG